MRKKLKDTLLGQMFVIVAVIAFMMAVAYLMTYSYMRRMGKEHTLQRNEQTLIQMEGKASEFCSTMEHIGTSLAYSPTTLAHLGMDHRQRIVAAEDMDAVFSNIMLLENDIAGIYLYDTTPALVAGTGAETGSHSPQPELHEKMEFSNLFTIGGEERNYYFIYFPIYDLDSPQYKTQLGMCAFLMKTDYFSEAVAGVEVTKHSQIYLTDADRRIIASNVQPDVRYMVSRLCREDTGYYIQERPLPIGGWSALNRIPEDELYQENDGVIRILAVTYLLAFGMLGMLVFFFYRRMIYPIQCVDAFIRRLAGHPSERMRAKREDEIGTVISSLDKMMDDIQQANRRVQVSQKQMYDEQLERKELQVLAYRNQINPHFLYNTFECIRAMALYYEVEDIAEITMALSNVFRFAVKADNMVAVEDEVKYIREYATIIDYRFMGKIGIYVETAPELASKKVIKLLLQPLVENAVFHGLEQKLGDGEVHVQIQKHGKGHMLVVVEDDGCGMDEEELQSLRSSLLQQPEKTKKKGIGITNIYQRLHLFYGDDVVFRIESRKGKGTKITMIIPDRLPEDAKIQR